MDTEGTRQIENHGSMRKTAKYTLFDHKRYQDIVKQLKTQSVLEKINKYKHGWTQHVSRMDRRWLRWAVTKYQPAGKRNAGRQLKGVVGCYTERGGGGPRGPSPWQHDDGDDALCLYIPLITFVCISETQSTDTTSQVVLGSRQEARCGGTSQL
jgi:hypothetical protein